MGKEGNREGTEEGNGEGTEEGIGEGSREGSGERKGADRAHMTLTTSLATLAVMTASLRESGSKHGGDGCSERQLEGTSGVSHDSPFLFPSPSHPDTLTSYRSSKPGSFAVIRCIKLTATLRNRGWVRRVYCRGRGSVWGTGSGGLMGL